VLAAGELSIIRERFVGNLLEERISVYNRAEREVEVALEPCRSGKVGVVVAKLDRLSRSMLDFAALWRRRRTRPGRSWRSTAPATPRRLLGRRWRTCSPRSGSSSGG
jgi:hypothetical protein